MFFCIRCAKYICLYPYFQNHEIITNILHSSYIPYIHREYTNKCECIKRVRLQDMTTKCGNNHVKNIVIMYNIKRYAR